MSSSTSASNKEEINDKLYSRQRYAFGDTAMKKLSVSNVFLSGLGGLGLEIAKNVALTGVNLLTLHDTLLTSKADLSTHFYLSTTLRSSDSSVDCKAQNRAAFSVPFISELNPYTKVNSSEVLLSKENFSIFDNYSVVILTEAPLSLQLEVNDYCHKKNIRFISCDAKGLFCWAFADFGTDFEVWDQDGELFKDIMISKITKDKQGIVSCLENHRHNLTDDDAVVFREVEGMTELNGTVHPVKVVDPFSFKIGDTSTFGEYKTNGIATGVKVIKKHSFLPLSESLLDPEILLCDFIFQKLEQSNDLIVHNGMQALHQFHQKHQSFPSPWNEDHAKQIIALAHQINNSPNNKRKLETLNERSLRLLSYTCQGSFVPMTSFLGGFVAQEIVKACTGKYTPLKQWLYFDGSELLDETKVDPQDFIPAGKPSRYDSQIICLGKKTCENLANAKLFMIGCGAIGCEMFKNFAMLGIGTGKNGRITVTDNDHIEMSNLNRQFLFRQKDIQSPKSTTAAEVVKTMNKDMNIISHLDKVEPASEEKFSDSFFGELDAVVNALDNIAARLYVDSRCVTNQRPLLESGTLSTKGHVQVILPHLTESYGSTRDPPEADIPFCMLKHFPNAIEHTIEWARDLIFQKIFSNEPQQFNKALEESNFLEEVKAGNVDAKVLRVCAKVIRKKPNSFEDCIRIARLKFEKTYNHNMHQLIHSFPLDTKLKDGSPFWASPKRPPMPLNFDFGDPLHQGFIISYASLLAFVYKIETFTQLDKVAKVCSTVQIPPFVPKSDKKIETDEKAAKPKEKETPEEMLNRCKALIIEFLENPKNKDFSVQVVHFEKDDDTNFHIDLINSASNLKARVYKIPEVDRLQTKRIAGRIMPAIATTTSCVSGLVSLELCKILSKTCCSNSLDRVKNAFLNLALPLFSFSEPGPAPKTKLCEGVEFTLWDRWDVKEGDITIGQFVEYFNKKYQLQINGIFQDNTYIYLPAMPLHKKRLPNKLSQYLKNPSNKPYIDLIVSFTKNGEDVTTPSVRYFFSK